MPVLGGGRIYRPIGSGGWSYQRTDSDTLLHYKFNESTVPIIDHALGNDAYDYVNAASDNITFQSSGLPGIQYSIKFSATRAIWVDPEGSNPTSAAITIPAASDFVLNLLFNPPDDTVSWSWTPYVFLAADAASGALVVLSYQTYGWKPPEFMFTYSDGTDTFVAIYENSFAYILSNAPNQLALIADKTNACPTLSVNGKDISGTVDPYGTATVLDIADVSDVTINAGGLIAPWFPGFWPNIASDNPFYFQEVWLSKGTTYTEGPVLYGGE